MILSKDNLKHINRPGLKVPDENIFSLPEKVLQFGTGVLLRGLPDYFIDKANRRGVFNGRVVVVKSTGTGPAAEFDQQDALYTIYLKGIADQQEITEEVICSAISRVLTAANDWPAILEFARNPDLQIVISNTTEVGIQLIKEDILQHIPASFPGKLLAVLYQRYKTFKGSSKSGLVIVPTELIVDNGKKLQAIVLELAHLNNLELEFIDWLQKHNSFCDSLVDRIVPGRPANEPELETERGYKDDLDIMAETYGLWAIQGDDRVTSTLSFAQADNGVVITPDIELFRELKLRLLNGSHTLSCAFAIISGFKTVKQAMDDPQFLNYITQLSFNEIAPAIPFKIEPTVAQDFAGKVLDRFRNPHIHHAWLSISLQYSTKMKMRVVPLIVNHYKQTDEVPACMALGFAAFIRFMKVEQLADGSFHGSINGSGYIVTDSQAKYFCEVWKLNNVNEVAATILSDKDLWGTDLAILPGFKAAVASNLSNIIVDHQ